MTVAEQVNVREGQAVIVNPGGLQGVDERPVSNGVVQTVAGGVVSVLCVGQGTAALEVGRAVELAVVGTPLVMSATILGARHAEGGHPTEMHVDLALGPELTRQELRAWTRLQLAVPVCASAFIEGTFRNVIGMTRDLSVGGLMVHSFAPLPFGPVIVSLHLDGAHRLALLGRTLEVLRPTDGARGWLARLQFVATDAAVRQVIGGFIARAILDQDDLDPTGRARSGIDDVAHFRAVTRRNRPGAY
jgi:hypothetical protein